MTTTITTPSGAPVDGVRIVDMPDLGAVTDTDSSFVGEHAGQGSSSATALRSPSAGSRRPSRHRIRCRCGMITFTDGVHTQSGISNSLCPVVLIGGTSPSATLTIGDVAFTDGARTVAGSNLAVTGGDRRCFFALTLTISPAAGVSWPSPTSPLCGR